MVRALEAGKKTDHPELFAFTTWAEVQEYVRNDQAGKDLAVFVRMIDDLGAEDIIHAADRLADERYAEVVISTAHKAKGREWDTVKIGNHFRQPPAAENGAPGRVPRGEAMLAYDEVWRYILAAQWTRIAQEEAFVGRSAEAGDDLGSRLVTARLAREVMRLCLLLARRYPPYSKWLGTAFAALPDIEVIVAALREAVDTGDAARRQAGLCTAYEAAGRWQNQLGLADPVEPTRRPYFDRPYPVIDAARFATALLERVGDATLAALPPVGAVDQYVDSTDVLSQRDLPRYIMDAVSREPSGNDRLRTATPVPDVVEGDQGGRSPGFPPREVSAQLAWLSPIQRQCGASKAWRTNQPMTKL